MMPPSCSLAYSLPGPPTPLVLTALPTWLDSPAFARLIRAADGYVLQVHSWEAPRTPEQPFTLCDPERAKRIHDSHLARARWMTENGYRHLLEPRMQ